MKTKTLLITTILCTSLMFGCNAPLFRENNITEETAKTSSNSQSFNKDARKAATSFVEHVNYARVALAMKNVELAKQHIKQAGEMITLIKRTSVQEKSISGVQSGRIVYEYDTEYKYHYFPIQTGPVQVKHISNGPIWAKNDLAVTDADIVYLTLDLRGNKAQNYLQKAKTAIWDNDLHEAEHQLEKLTKAVVKVESKQTVPSDKAIDNIALARNFIKGKNYDGARYALKHADEGLDEMQKSDNYLQHRSEIIAMREDVDNLQSYITKKDPTALEQGDKKLSKWWKDLKAWNNK